MASLVKKVQNTVFQHNLFSRGNKIVIGVSGGPDSSCLLDILCKLQKKYSTEIIAAHVNYGLRGSDSKKDEEFVRKLAKEHGLEIFVFQFQKKEKQPSENELRNIRYDFFEKIRKENNFDLIAVAHNADDQVETFLMRILRGAGMVGLSAIRYKNKRIIRPLLNIPRTEILDYLEDNGLKYQTDKTNLESKFSRNKIRNRLIPYLEKNYNPRLRETIFDAVESIALDQSLLLELAEKDYQKNKELSVKKLLRLHPALLSRIIFQAIAQKKGDATNIESAHIREIVKILKSTKNKRQTVLFKGLKAARIGDKLKIEKI